MQTVKCQDCFREFDITSGIETCPQCGVPLPRNSLSAGLSQNPLVNRSVQPRLNIPIAHPVGKKTIPTITRAGLLIGLLGVVLLCISGILIIIYLPNAKEKGDHTNSPAQETSGSQADLETSRLSDASKPRKKVEYKELEDESEPVKPLNPEKAKTNLITPEKAKSNWILPEKPKSKWNINATITGTKMVTVHALARWSGSR